MKLWLVKRIDETDYDHFAGFVVRTENEESAWAMVNDRDKTIHMGWDLEKVRVREEWTITEIKTEGDEEIILSDHRAG